MSVTILNNFGKFKDEFKADTGLDFSKENMSIYIAYYNARLSDNSYQVLFNLSQSILNKVDNLPDAIRLRIGEMISSHPDIKALLKK